MIRGIVMTVGEMRKLMLRKVVPEKVIPQNIVDFLVDESAELAEPDAYTFLQRLRGLGVGSADFVYLLEGCGAPEMAVRRIKENPAMNLQSLILTLETSGMTSKDYMRILYTARQIWERTLSTRLEKVEEVTRSGENGEPTDDTKGTEGTGVAYKSRIEDEVAHESEQPEQPEQNEQNTNAEADEPDETDDFDKDDDFSAALRALTEETEKALSEKPEQTEPSEQSEQSEVSEEPAETENSTANSEIPSDSVETADEQSDSENADVTESSENSENSDNSDNSDSTMGFYVGGTEEFESLLGRSIPEDYAQPVKPSIEDVEDFDDFGYSESTETDEAQPDDDITPVEESSFVKDRKHFTVQIDYSELESAADGEETAEGDDSSDENAYPTTNELDGQSVSDDSFFDVQESGSDEQKSAYNGDTTAIIAIDRAMLEENLANIASLSDIAASIANDNSTDNDVDNIDNSDDTENSGKDEGKTGKSKKSDKSDKFEVHIAEIDDDYDDDYDYINSRSHYNVGALTAAGVGAIIVAGCGVMSGIVFGMTPPDPIGYAENESEIFTEIYYSYNEKIAGGDSYYGYSHQNVEIFGDLLVTQNGFGTFTDGDNVYTVTAEEITVNKFAEGALEFVGTLSAPENTRIVDAVSLEGDALCAVFDGETCGYMKVSGGTLAYTVRQDGRLTDFAVDENGEICIGSLYTPKFYKTFNSADVEVYLPKLGTEYKAMAATSVIPSRIRGYSYGVSAAYSAVSGKTLRADAVLGNPVYASAHGQFALNGAETGLLIRVDYSEVEQNGQVGQVGQLAEPVQSAQSAQSQAANTETTGTTGTDAQPQRPAVYTAECGRLSGIAFFGNGSAALESGKVTLRDVEFTPVAVLENFSSIPDKMIFRGNTLLVSDKERVFLAMDCTNPAIPAPRTLRQVTGKAGKEAAVTVEQTAEGIKVSEYTVAADGTALLGHSSLLELNGEQRGTLEIADASCIVADGALHGAAYCYFDGVSVIWEFAALDQSPKRAMLYDDKTGITLAFPMNGKVYAQCARGLVEIS